MLYFVYAVVFVSENEGKYVTKYQRYFICDTIYTVQFESFPVKF